MGKTIKLTEGQIRRFFGEGFGRKILGESGNDDRMRRKEEFLNSDPVQDIAKKAYGKTMSHPDRDNGMPTDDSTYHLGFHHTSREGKDLPGYGGAVAKIADFSATDLNRENAIYGDNNALLERILEEHKKYLDAEEKKNPEKANEIPRNLNLMDVLEIMHKLKDQKTDPKNAGKEAFDFLNSININYILSNFVTVNAPDYVFWRLKNLTPQEIANVKETYGRDFSGFGQRCDGCGIKEWKTTVTPFEHDDAHINLEYMGSEAAKNAVKINENAGGPRRFNTFPIAFQIHHMNENPGDNSPLNLSCLCPNCHTLTGSYGIRKGDITADTQKILSQLEELSGGISGATDSLNSAIPDEEQEKIVKNLKAGDFERRDITNSQIGVNGQTDFMLNPENVDIIKRISEFGVTNPKSFIEGFNKMLYGIWDDGYEMYAALHKLPGSYDLKEDKKTKKNTSSKKTQTFKLDGVEFTCVLRCIDGKITVEIFAGESPFVFSAFKNRLILLNQMYYESPENRDQAKLEVRDMIFGSVLNAYKNYRTKMSNWRAPEYLQKDAGKNNAKEKTENDIVADRIANIKPIGDAYITANGEFGIDSTGKLDAESLFNKPETKTHSQGRLQDVISQKQARQRSNFNEGNLRHCYDILTTNNEKVLAGKINHIGKIYGSELVDFLLKKRKEGVGKQIPSEPENVKLDAMRNLLANAEGGFYREKPQKIK